MRQTDKILPKLLKVKAELGAVTKSANNPFFNSKYADLNAHLDTVEPVLQKHGLILMQPTIASPNGNTVETLIVDSESGQFFTSSLSLVLVKQDMQQMGSAITYARRYTLAALLGMKAEDDDGNSASDLKKKSPPPKSKPKNTLKLPENDEF